MDIGIVNDLLACRACLATDTKLIGIHEFQLDSSFEIVFGTRVSENDSFPQFLCHYCCSLLFKCEAYINRFRRSQEVLTSILLENQTLDTDDLRSLDRDALELSIPLAIQKQPESSILKSVHVSPIRLNLSKLPRIKIIPHGMESTTELGENDRTYMVESGDQVFQVVDIGQQDHIITSDAEDDPQTADSAQVKDKPKDKYKNINLHPNVDMLVLTLEEQLEEIAGKQNSVGYVSAFLKCEFCYKGFLKEKSYNAHMAMHDPANGPFECPVCKIRCESKQKMRLHSRMAHERRYICKLCGHVDAQPASARAHQQWHDGVRHECHVCTQTFTKSSALSSHLRLHHTGAPCATCGAPLVAGHSDGDTCHHCKQEMTPEEDRYCEDCQVQFDSVEAYNTHINTSAVHSKTDSNLWEHCKQCGESFESLERLEAHCTASHPASFRCTQCKLTLTSAKGLQIHVGQCHRSKGDAGQIDFPSRRYICQFCGVELDSLEGLTKHKESHSGEKPFLCVHCNRSFRHPQLLQVHMRIHTGETPYQCPRCFRCFKHKANLNRHTKVHTGEKPYTCDVCLKSFTQSNSLKLHVRTVHLKLPAPYRRRRRDNRRDDITDDQ